MRRLSLLLILGILIVLLTGCGNSETAKNNTPDQSELNPSKAEQVEKDIRQLLVNSLAEMASNLKEVKTDGGSTYSITDPQQWAEYRVSDLTMIIYSAHQLLELYNIQLVKDKLNGLETTWKIKILPFLKKVEQREVVAFVNDVNKGFELAIEGIKDGNPQKIEQAGDIFAKLNELVKYNRKSVSNRQDSVPVLLYHHLAPKKADLHKINSAVVPVEEFQAQMVWLKENGYTTPTLREFFNWLKGEGDLPPKSVLITFDDGYASLKTYGFPILKELGLRAVVFIIGSMVGINTDSLQYLDWDDIRSIEESGTVDFQNHTYDGHRSTGDAPSIISWLPQEFNEDLRKLEVAFKDQGLKKPFAFSYPFGAKTEIMVDVLSRRGYQLAFTTEQGFVRQGDDSYALKRIIIRPGTTLEQFQQRITTEFRK